MSTTIDWEQELDAWEEKYKPIFNHNADNPIWEDYKFETYGEDLEFVKAQNPDHVWTLVEGDDGNLYITNGFHYVNRLNYIVTDLPFEGEFLEVPYYIFEENEDDDEDL
jgi:hypothetical protein